MKGKFLFLWEEGEVNILVNLKKNILRTAKNVLVTKEENEEYHRLFPLIASFWIYWNLKPNSVLFIDICTNNLKLCSVVYFFTLVGLLQNIKVQFKSRKQYLIKLQLYSHLPSTISQTIKNEQNIHCWKSKCELMNDLSKGSPTHGHTSFGQSA